MSMLDTSELKTEITFEDTEIVLRKVKLPEGQYACPFCEFSSGKITIGHRDFGYGPDGTGPIYQTCGRCRGTQIVVPCKKCGFLLPNVEFYRKYQKCHECLREEFLNRVDKEKRLKQLINF